jgi:hypothetical protein
MNDSAIERRCKVYEFRHVRGHIEVFLNGIFQFSADTLSEAKEEIALYGDDELHE